MTPLSSNTATDNNCHRFLHPDCSVNGSTYLGCSILGVVAGAAVSSQIRAVLTRGSAVNPKRYFGTMAVVGVLIMAVSAFLIWQGVFPLIVSIVFAAGGCGVLILSVVALVRKSPPY